MMTMVKGKNQNAEISEEIINAVQYPSLATKYLAKNNKSTEFHKSCSVGRNAIVNKNPKLCKCTICPRIFISELKFKFILIFLRN